jgi:hypothetical protein
MSLKRTPAEMAEADNDDGTEFSQIEGVESLMET